MSTNGTTSTTSNASLTRLAAQRLHQIATSPVPPEVKDKVSLALVDYFGAIASGLQAPWAAAVCQYARGRKGSPEAHAWGIQEDVSAETAAFVNATLAHSAIRDDMHLKSNSHIGSMVISAALALAQRDSWTSDQLLRAVIGGYEIASILGVAVQQSSGYNRHFRPSGIVGAFGAAGAAVTAAIVGSDLKEDIAVNALGFAANMASGFNEWSWAGGVEIYTEMGTASQSGIVAFDLASAGMECSHTLLEGQAGLFAALSASNGDALFRTGLQSELGQGLLDVRFKPVPGCNYAQTPLAVALQAAQQRNISFSDIEKVTITCTAQARNYPGCNNAGPFSNVQQTKMSIQFGACAVLLHGEVSEKLFQKFEDREIAALAVDCVLESDPGFDEDFRQGRQPARIEVRLADGSALREELADVPWLGAEAVLERFGVEMGTVMPSQELREKFVSVVQGLGDTKDGVSAVFEVFKGANSLKDRSL